MDYNLLTKTEQKSWKLCYADNIECAICHDGLLFMFAIADVAHILVNYPAGEDCFYFNESRDREIAEMTSIANGKLHVVTVNPQFVYQNFKEILT